LNYTDPAVKETLMLFDVIVADGMPLVLASALTRTPIPERIATTDWFYRALLESELNQQRIFFLGAKPLILEEAVSRVRRLYPSLNIVGYRNGYFPSGSLYELAREIVKLDADIVWVGMGNPLQLDIALELAKFVKPNAVIYTCGGLFDHVSGAFPRAPRWMRMVGLEWLFRLLQEPRRLFPRYFRTNPHFIWLLISKTGWWKA
jgi:exopolysaccharide biosynthesis WecB/TagA/CpsF family protein